MEEFVEDWFRASQNGSGMHNLTNGTNHTSTPKCPGAHKMDAEWIETVFGQCVDTPLRYVAFFVGLSSIACWLVAQAPQMITNCRLGIADKALSFWFLLQWFLGDATNLIGALLTHQLASQIITAVYFCMIDVLMMGQFLYYVVKNQGWKGLLHIFRCPKADSKIAAMFLPGLVCTMFLASWPHMNLLVGGGAMGGAYSSDNARSGRVLLHYQLSDTEHHDKPPVDVHDVKPFVGYVIGCISAAFYLGSRMPQIVQNFTRCSVKGVSLPMFILAVMGNVTYSLGIFLYSVDGYFLIQKLPWIIGSIGTLCFDFTIFAQFIVFQGFGKKCGINKNLTDEEEGLYDDERTPLLTGSSGLPCLNQKGNIQASSQHEGGISKVNSGKRQYGLLENDPDY